MKTLTPEMKEFIKNNYGKKTPANIHEALQKKFNMKVSIQAIYYTIKRLSQKKGIVKPIKWYPVKKVSLSKHPDSGGTVEDIARSISNLTHEIMGEIDELNKSYVAMLNRIKLELIKSRADLRMVTKVTGT